MKRISSIKASFHIPLYLLNSNGSLPCHFPLKTFLRNNNVESKTMQEHILARKRSLSTQNWGLVYFRQQLWFWPLPSASTSGKHTQYIYDRQPALFTSFLSFCCYYFFLSKSGGYFQIIRSQQLRILDIVTLWHKKKLEKIF